MMKARNNCVDGTFVVMMLLLAVLSPLLHTAVSALDAEDAPIPIPNPFTMAPMASARKDRFPSREERVRLYMSNWYNPPCSSNAKVHYEYRQDGNTNWTSLWIKEPENVLEQSDYLMESKIEPDQAFFLHRETVMDCMTDGVEPYVNRTTFRRNMQIYCRDVIGNLLTTWDHVQWESSFPAIANKGAMEHDVPLLLQFGDLKYSHVFRFVSLPLIKKFRSATTAEEIRRVTQPVNCSRSDNDNSQRPAVVTPHSTQQLQPIVWKLATHRHFGKLLDRTHVEDTPWDEKINMAVFLGQLTGSHLFDKNKTDLENCHNMMRCRLVYEHGNSTYVYAKLTSTRNRMPAVLNGVEMIRPKVSLDKLLQFKGIIMLEGNDVASGLKWALLSQSVVLMPYPQHTSWAMEELLEPWVHYIPLNEYATDVEEKMKWVVEHDAEARRIAERGTQWMEDLVYHPDALEDDRWIQEEILRRFMAHFERVESVQRTE
ncbi:hypothetical protein MPSEU_000820000 [Mayamaea pseudoterrestris]|nr:hypothetical protein MPSEU_000820000 [Mayamaea pseudoterrestris]